jgi:broad specificity phosphatase PhoE
MTLTLVRHSEVIEKYQGCYNGHIEIPLSKKGLQDAQELGKKLKNMHFDAIYCSDLLRAKQTLQAFHLEKQNIIYTKELREKSWGKHEGMSFDEICATGLEYKNFEQWLEILDGEDVDTYIQRIKDYFYNVIAKTKKQKILIVTHAGVIKTMLHITHQIPIEKAFSKKLHYSDTFEIML